MAAWGYQSKYLILCFTLSLEYENCNQVIGLSQQLLPLAQGGNRASAVEGKLDVTRQDLISLGARTHTATTICNKMISMDMEKMAVMQNLCSSVDIECVLL